MPNITSVERLARLYEDDKNYYVMLMIVYNPVAGGMKIKIERVHFVPIEFLAWECLTIGALGWGQIQIANANNIVVAQKYSRKKWMLELCNTLFDFYPREIGKIGKRIEYFKNVRKQWEMKEDIWKKED